MDIQWVLVGVIATITTIAGIYISFMGIIILFEEGTDKLTNNQDQDNLGKGG